MRWVTTGLEVAACAFLAAAAVVAFGLAGALGAIGCACLGLSFAISRGSA